MITSATPPTIREATADDLERCLTVLTTAFQDDPVGRLLVPSATQRPEVLRRYYRHIVTVALDNGGVVELANNVACAVWFGSTTLHHLDLDQLAAVFGPYESGFRNFAAALDQAHPLMPEHEYLLMLGVSPDSQGRGLGTALLNHRLAALDCQQRPAYLEATTERAWRGLYQRTGFKLNGSPIDTAEGGIIPLWRSPQPRSKARRR